jgi:hypothetical protein
VIEKYQQDSEFNSKLSMKLACFSLVRSGSGHTGYNAKLAVVDEKDFDCQLTCHELEGHGDTFLIVRHDGSIDRDK